MRQQGRHLRFSAVQPVGQSGRERQHLADGVSVAKYIHQCTDNESVQEADKNQRHQHKTDSYKM
jgi:hypothetical protein